MALKAYREYDDKLQKMVWDPNTIEIRTKSVEQTLEPLVRQVCKFYQLKGKFNAMLPF